MFQPLQRRLGRTARELEAHQRGALPLIAEYRPAGRTRHLELAQQLTGPAQEGRGVDAGARRDRHRGQHAGHRGMDARLEERQPHAAAQDQVDERTSHTGPVRQHQRRQTDPGDEQSEPGQLRGVEERDHDHGPDVIDDRDSGEKHLQTDGNAWTDQRQDPQSERDVGRHGNSPTGRAGSARVDEAVDRRRDDHPTQRRPGRQRRLARLGQLAHQRFALDLQTDHEEEDGHQAVVDP